MGNAYEHDVQTILNSINKKSKAGNILSFNY